MFAIETDTEELDKEWKELIAEAKSLGITREEIRDFLLMAANQTAAQR